MANPPDGRKKTDIRTRYKRQIDQLKSYAERFEKALENLDNPDWMIPERNGWNGDLRDIENIKLPFLRDEHYEDIAAILKNTTAPGTIGDLALIQLQGDFLAAFERAFRERHKTFVRSAAHASARQRGHHKMMLEKMLTGYLQRLLSKAAGGSS